MSPIARDPESGRRYITARGRSWLLISLLFVAGVFSLYNYAVDRDQDSADRVQKTALREAALTSCEVGNRLRVIRIQDYRRDIAQLRAQINTLQANLQLIGFVPANLFASGPLNQNEVVQTNDETIKRSRLSVDYKRQTIRDEIRSVRETAVSPGSPISDCELRVGG